MRKISVSVTSLASFISRSGDLSPGSYGSVSGADGTKLHRKIFDDLKEEYGDGITCEAPLDDEYEENGITLYVNGRADVLLREKDGDIRIIELKSFNSARDSFESLLRQEHMTQLELYGILYLRRNLDADKVMLTLRYVSLTSLNAYEDSITMDRDEAAGLWVSYCSRYIDFAGKLIDYNTNLLTSIRQMKFPYDILRQGQKKMMKTVLSSLRSNEALFVLAPTGTGKTISTLYPAIKGLLDRRYQRIFYLTAKTATRAVAAKALNDMRSGGLLLRSITLASKESMCPYKKKCDSANCPLAKGYYDRVRYALEAILTRDEITPEIVCSIASDYSICPHEFSLDTMNYCSVVIGDYNHAFDPRVRLIRSFEDENAYVNAVLVDEAHNLVDRSREMYSAGISRSLITRMRNIYKNRNSAIEALIQRLDDYFIRAEQCFVTGQSVWNMNEGISERDVLKTSEWEGMRSIPRSLYENIWKVLRLLSPELEDMPRGELREVSLEFFFELRFFLTVIEQFYNESYITGVFTSRGDITVKLTCLDSSDKLDGQIRDNYPVVFFSATLSPYEYYRNVLIGKNADYCRELTLSSPFPPENLQVMIETSIPTSYKQRAASADRLTERIIRELRDLKGNYMVFFPSFEYLDQIHAKVSELLSGYPADYTIVKQKPNMTAEEKNAYLSHFTSASRNCLIGFAVLGGHFGEGIDLVGDRLSGVIIVGVGLPRITPERQVLSNYYDEKFGDGFSFAYRFPGWEKVLQAVGRVIRTEDDTGFALLIDERLGSPEYLSLFPDHWKI